MRRGTTRLAGDLERIRKLGAATSKTAADPSSWTTSSPASASSGMNLFAAQSPMNSYFTSTVRAVSTPTCMAWIGTGTP